MEAKVRCTSASGLPNAGRKRYLVISMLRGLPVPSVIGLPLRSILQRHGAGVGDDNAQQQYPLKITDHVLNGD